MRKVSPGKWLGSNQEENVRKHRLIAATLLCVGPAICAAQSVTDLNARCEVSLDKADYKAAATSCRSALAAAAREPGSESLVRALINMSSYYTDRAQDAEAIPLTEDTVGVPVVPAGTVMVTL